MTEDPVLSAGDYAHAVYTAKTGILGHSENPTSPFYIAQGNAAAQQSNVAMGGGAGSLTMWMTGPFHELGVLLPQLVQTGYGEYGGAAALDVGSRTGPMPASLDWPLTYPSTDHLFPFVTYEGGETPNPLAPCPASFVPGQVSAPLIVLLGPDSGDVGAVSADLIAADGSVFDTCTYSENTYDSGDAWQPVASSILRYNRTVVVFASRPLTPGSAYTLRVTISGQPTVTVPFHTSFYDTPVVGQFFEDIGWLAGRGLTNGFADGGYHPTAPLSRQAMAAFLYRYAGSTASAPTSATFTDTPAGTGFFTEIEWLAAVGVSTGTPSSDGSRTFNPTGAVSRQAMAAFLYRLSDSPEFTPPASPTFVDVPTRSPYFAEVEWLASTGITTGTVRADGSTVFSPGSPVSRQAIAAFLHRSDALR